MWAGRVGYFSLLMALVGAVLVVPSLARPHGALAADPALVPGFSPGCVALNGPEFDSQYHRSDSIYQEFYPGEVVTVSAGPPHTLTYGNASITLWVSPSDTPGTYADYPGTVRWIVPATDSDPRMYSIFWELNDGPYETATTTWDVRCGVEHVISGRVTDLHTGRGIHGICVDVWPWGDPNTIVAGTESTIVGVDQTGSFSMFVPPGKYQVSYVDCRGWDYAAEWYGTTTIEPVDVSASNADASMALTTGSMTGLVDRASGLWALSQPRSDYVFEFYYGNPGDFPFVGDWNCDGVETPGMYRQSDGYVYLRNSNTQGIADIKFFFGNPGDVPLAGDFNGDGCDTVSIYRPSNQRFYIINELGENDGGLGAAEVDYVFGNPGDKPFVGDFDGDGVDTVGLHRETTGLVYFRNSHTQGNADNQYIFGNPGDKLVAGNFSGFWIETPAVYRASDTTFYIRHTNTQGNADRSEVWDFTGPTWHPVAGVYGLAGGNPTITSLSHSDTIERNQSP